MVFNIQDSQKQKLIPDVTRLKFTQHTPKPQYPKAARLAPTPNSFPNQFTHDNPSAGPGTDLPIT